MLRVSGAFATRFMEELRRVNLAVPLERDDLGTSPEEHRAVEEFLNGMQKELARVLFPEVAHGENSGRAQAAEAVPPQAGH